MLDSPSHLLTPRMSLLFKAEQYSFVWTSHILFIHSFVGEYVGCLCLLATLELRCCDIRVDVQVSIWVFGFDSLGV